MSWLWLLACTAKEPADSPVDSEHVAATSWTLTAADPLPANAEGVVLLARFDGESVELEGALPHPAIDIDGPHDDTWPLRAQLFDAQGALIFERTLPGPIQVRDFLSYYSELVDLDLLELYPQLGDFPLPLPLLEDAVDLRVQLRDVQGAWSDVGSWRLREAIALEVEPFPPARGFETLVSAAPPALALDIAILGDGYTEAELPRFREQAAQLAEHLGATEPFTSLAPRLNVHRVDVVSNESGAGFDCGEGCGFRDTAFGSVFIVELANALLGTDYRAVTVFQMQQWDVARAAALVPWDMVVVLVNTEHDGGFAMHYASVPIGVDGDWPDTAVHELSHVLGRLGDEYEADFCILSESLPLWPNISASGTEPPWMHWIEDDTPLPTPDSEENRGVTGAFAGALNCEQLYRPSQSCRMKGSSSAGFCDVCSEQLVRRSFDYADLVAEVSWEDNEGLTLTADVMPGATLSWTLDGQVVGDGAELSLEVEQLSEGAELALEANLESAWVRQHEGELSERRSWTVGVQAPR